MASLHYLTVQDILWINLQVTKKVRKFSFARLEEATFYQYAYGESNTLFPQAARFVSGFCRMNPFSAGNEVTALIACLGFLGINGYTTAATDVQLKAWFQKVSGQESGNADSIAEIAIPIEDHHATHAPDVHEVVTELLERFSGLIESLFDAAAA